MPLALLNRRISKILPKVEPGEPRLVVAGGGDPGGADGLAQRRGGAELIGLSDVGLRISDFPTSDFRPLTSFPPACFLAAAQ